MTDEQRLLSLSLNLLSAKASPKMKWRNTRWGRNTEYLKHDEVSYNFPKLWKLLQAFGTAFDDEWDYKLTENYVIRCPLGEKPQSGSFWEDKDRRKKEIKQRKLLEAPAK